MLFNANEVYCGHLSEDLLAVSLFLYILLTLGVKLLCHPAAGPGCYSVMLMAF